MENQKSRWFMLAGAIVVLFIATIGILLNVIPGPHKKLDYLVIGAIATFLSMTLLWIVMMQEWVNPEAAKLHQSEEAEAEASEAAALPEESEPGAKAE